MRRVHLNNRLILHLAGKKVITLGLVKPSSYNAVCSLIKPYLAPCGPCFPERIEQITLLQVDVRAGYSVNLFFAVQYTVLSIVLCELLNLPAWIAAVE